jgi:hypothetical protein
MNKMTKIEKFDYFEINDTSKSWYFDAERFDPNFPLVCSYSGGAGSIGGGDNILGVYNYFNIVSEYYRSQKDYCVIIVESKYPNEYLGCRTDDNGNLIGFELPESFKKNLRATLPGYDENEPIDPVFKLEVLPLEGNVEFFPDRKFKFRLCERVGDHYYLRLIFCARHDSLEDFKSRVFYAESRSYYPSWSFENRGFPYLQTIATQDWDLVKKYFFFMIRNHQYKYADLVYYLKQLDNGGYYYPAYADGDTLYEIFAGLPEDLRKSPEKCVSHGIASCEYIERGDGLLRV